MIKENSYYFIWPESRFVGGLHALLSMPSIEAIEGKLRNYFPSGFPVLCSSGRASLTLALEYSNQKRSDLVGLFPYASHCVIDAVARICTPLFGPTSINANLRIVYHQWGYVQEYNLPINTIEDCVDTLCVKGAELFPGGGSFEIWSLPKILGISSGAVLWCKDEQAAKKLRKIRDNRNRGFFQWILRLMSKKIPFLYNYWQGAEPFSGCLSRLQTGEIMIAIENWDTFVADRFEKLELMWPMTVDFLEKPVNRLPSVVPIDCLISENEIVEIGLTAGTRMIEKLKPDGSRMLNKVLPIPIHQDLSLTELKRIVDFLKINNKQ
jgi:putative PLP-dependent aminotransferase (TIGR04422 family)